MILYISRIIVIDFISKSVLTSSVSKFGQPMSIPFNSESSNGGNSWDVWETRG